MNLAIVIPNYNHGNKIAGVIDSLAFLNLPIIIVDDDSDKTTKAQIKAVSESNEQVQVVTHEVNQGKGGAVMTGMKTAHAQGFSHMLQVDADGQHDINHCQALIELAQSYPNELISGRPIFDDSIPLGRRFSRHITHFWVWVETLSFSVKDTMCGFRVYPLAPCIELMNKINLGKRMDFDIEIMVRLYWQGTVSRFLPTKVIYPQDGISHFQPINDNILISWMHTRLVFGMFIRSPRLIWRNLKGRRS